MRLRADPDPNLQHCFFWWTLPLKEGEACKGNLNAGKTSHCVSKFYSEICNE